MRARLAIPALGLWALAGCAAPPPPPPGTASPEEAGLRMVADRAEARLKSSGRIEQRPELDAYLRGVLCRVVGPGCAELRLYLVDEPGFNATAWPNGVVELWSGTLLRLENEAQLALVLGHEAVHYEQRHTAQVWSRAQQSLGMGALLGVLAGAPELGVAMGALAVLAYSREMEREADRLALERLARAGYDPNEAPEVWEYVLAERARDPAGAPSPFLSTHPTDAERIASLRTMAATLPRTPSAEPLGRDAYRAAIAPARGRWLARELARRAFAESELVLDRLLAAEPRSGELLFFAGELRRLRDGPGDAEAALARYREAARLADAPVETWRSMGFVAKRLGREAEAREALRTYLARAGAAPDRPMIERMLAETE
ncbi:MAG: M48 family metalloprotease [Geminicoccaceae bacterium]|nr:M48 family metalloprotease [Geminicoccaceae bacterium]